MLLHLQHIYNNFTKNHMWWAIEDSNFGLILTSILYPPIITCRIEFGVSCDMWKCCGNSISPKIIMSPNILFLTPQTNKKKG